MSNNYVGVGDHLEVTAPRTVASGDPVKVRDILGVTLAAAASAAAVQIATRGIFTIAKQAVAVTAGDKVYLHTTSNNITLTATSGTLIGVAVESKTAGDANVKVRLNGSF
jgi:predicted RecA/RadA family phage recombinase